jgi:hypothetical protein
MTRNLATALAVSAALALGACGDDEEETTGGETGGQTTALTKDAYIEQASEICARTNGELGQMHGNIQQDLAVIEQEMADLRALPAPEGEEAQVDAMVSAGEHALEIERQAAEAGGEVQGEDPYFEFTRLAQQFGVEGGCTEAGR